MKRGFVNARSALFDIYGDHLLTRGEQAPVAALVRLLAPAGISAPAVRTAVSRMARQGWLTPVRLPGGAGYGLTEAAVRRLRQAGDRIYRREQPSWDGRWHVVVLERVTERARRERLRSSLGYLGYACLDGGTWISPHPSIELDALLGAERVRAERFAARYDGDQRALAARAWDLDGLASAYSAWIGQAREILAPVRDAGPSPGALADETVFAVRSELVHEWRKFLFIDPGLPADLLPARWPGTEAADLFHDEADRLLPAASRFVDRCLAGGGESAGQRRGESADQRQCGRRVVPAGDR